MSLDQATRELSEKDIKFIEYYCESATKRELNTPALARWYRQIEILLMKEKDRRQEIFDEIERDMYGCILPVEAN